GPGFPHGYEAQVNSTHRDPVKTGSLYNMVPVKEILVPPDTWFTQEIEAVGNHIIIKVNGKTTVDTTDAKNTYTQGHFAFQHHDPGLKRTLTATNLIMLGIGAIIGAGFFVLTGNAAAHHAGPAVALSFVLGGVVCAFAGLCYAEMASTVPIAGSAYTYAYATMGEFVAWLIGWDLILEYMVGATGVAIGWSGYVTSRSEEGRVG